MIIENEVRCKKCGQLMELATGRTYVCRKCAYITDRIIVQPYWNELQGMPEKLILAIYSLILMKNEAYDVGLLTPESRLMDLRELLNKVVINPCKESFENLSEINIFFNGEGKRELTQGDAETIRSLLTLAKIAFDDESTLTFLKDKYALGNESTLRELKQKIMG